MADHSVRNGVLITVVGGLILAFVLWLVTGLQTAALSILWWLWTQIKLFAAHLVNPVTLPWWLLYLSGLGFLFLLCIVIHHRRREAESRRIASQDSRLYKVVEDVPEDDPRSYTLDVFFGVRWRWNMEDGGTPENIRPFCPRCDMELYPTERGGRYGSSHMIHPTYAYLGCDNCGYKGETTYMRKNELSDIVRRQIQRKVRTGEWKQTHKT